MGIRGQLVQHPFEMSMRTGVALARCAQNTHENLASLGSSLRLRAEVQLPRDDRRPLFAFAVVVVGGHLAVCKPVIEALRRYGRCMLIEKGLVDAVNSPHLHAVSSAAVPNVSFDVLQPTMAIKMYRLLPRTLHAFERAQPRQLWRRFLKHPCHVRITEDEVVVELPRRAPNLILIASRLLEECAPVSWWEAAVRNPLSLPTETLALLVA